MTSDHKNLMLYIGKCVTGCVLLLGIGQAVPQVDLSWVLISVMLVLSPDEKESIPLAIIRVKANLIASFTSMLFLMMSANVAIAICLATAITIIACYIFELMAGSRVALVGVIIILLHPQGDHLWSTVIERVLSVIMGCAVGLLLSFAFHRNLPWKSSLSGRINE